MPKSRLKSYSCKAYGAKEVPGETLARQAKKATGESRVR